MIKFRAWIISEKRHLPVILIDFYDKIVWCSDENNPTVKVDINRVFNFDEIVLEQWTGLKDKNGTVYQWLKAVDVIDCESGHVHESEAK